MENNLDSHSSAVDLLYIATYIFIIVVELLIMHVNV